MSLGTDEIPTDTSKKCGLFLCSFVAINMSCLTKEQRVWICLEYARANNALEITKTVKMMLTFDSIAPILRLLLICCIKI